DFASVLRWRPVRAMPETEIGTNSQTGDETMDPEMVKFFNHRMMADRDRHSTNATSYDKPLEMQYAGSKELRGATASRGVLEAGSGRTRAETNAPLSSSAQQHPPNVAGA